MFNPRHPREPANISNFFFVPIQYAYILYMKIAFYNSDIPLVGTKLQTYDCIGMVKT